jgi:hypothetical protein
MCICIFAGVRDGFDLWLLLELELVAVIVIVTVFILHVALVLTHFYIVRGKSTIPYRLAKCSSSFENAVRSSGSDDLDRTT